jgi:hypothetical protein
MECLDFGRFVRALPDILFEDQHWRPQAIETAIEHIDYDFIGRFESLQADTNRMMERYYPHFTERLSFDSPDRNRSEAKLPEYYEPQLIEIVAHCYAEDFDRFSYDKDLP